MSPSPAGALVRAMSLKSRMRTSKIICLEKKQDIATLAYLVDFAYTEQSTNALICRGNRSRKHVVVVVKLQW